MIETPQAMSRSMKWQVAVLLLQPPLSGAYLLAMRAGIVPPSYGAGALFTVLPGLALFGAISDIRHFDKDERLWQAALIALAVLEVAWGVLTLAIVAFATAWRLK